MRVHQRMSSSLTLCCCEQWQSCLDAQQAELDLQHAEVTTDRVFTQERGSAEFAVDAGGDADLSCEFPAEVSLISEAEGFCDVFEEKIILRIEQILGAFDT